MLRGDDIWRKAFLAVAALSSGMLLAAIVFGPGVP